MADIRDLIFRIKGDTSDFERSMNGVANETKKAETSFTKLAAAVGVGNLGYAAFNKSLELARTFISGSVGAYEESELAVTRLQAGIDNVKSATDKHIDALVKQASALQKTTRFSDDAVISAQGILTTFQLNQRAIEKITPRLIDMAEGLAKVDGTMPDLESNAILVAKAIGGEDVAGLSGALRRVGVIMTSAQEEMLKMGTVEERVSIVTEILDQNFRGLGEAAGETTAGKVAKFKNNVNDLQEKLGQLLATGLNPVLDVLNKHQEIIPIVTASLLALATAFVAVKVAAGISAVITGATVAISALATAATAAQGALLSLGAVSLAAFGAGIIYEVKRITNALNEATDAQNSLQNALASADVSDTLTIQKLQKQATIARNSGNQKEADRIATVIKSMTARAEGGPVNSGQSYLVGERGPELFTPKQSGNIAPNSSLGGVNVTVNMGMYAGLPIERREIAKTIWRDLVREARANGVSLPIIPGVGVQ